MNYQRVIPRDLFNESKLLKCLGQLAVMIHDGRLLGVTVEIIEEYEYPGFRINQNQSSGRLFCDSLRFETSKGQGLYFSLPYNSRDPYPLILDGPDDDVYVFDDAGNLTQVFIAFIEGLK